MGMSVVVSRRIWTRVALGMASAGLMFAVPRPIDRNAFTANTVVIDFDTIPAGDRIASQYANLGVTFSSSVVGNHLAWLYYPSPMQAANYPPCSVACEPITLFFARPVRRVGFEISTNSGITYLATSGGRIGYAFTNIPVFAGIEDPDGFRTLTIDASATPLGAIILDNLRLEFLETQGPGSSYAVISSHRPPVRCTSGK